MKSIYIACIRWLRSILQVFGVFKLLDASAIRSRFALWFRSLFAIYDVEDFAKLDIPWWPFSVSQKVENFLKSKTDMHIFEWGSGASSLWLSKRVNHVMTVEHDVQWAKDLQSLLPANVTIQCSPPTKLSLTGAVMSQKKGFQGLDFSDYVNEIDKHSLLFDVIVIDGRAREACLAKAIQHLAHDGLIIFDNVDRRRYRKAIAQHASRIDVEYLGGLTPCLPYPTQAALISLKKA